MEEPGAHQEAAEIRPGGRAQLPSGHSLIPAEWSWSRTREFDDKRAPRLCRVVVVPCVCVGVPCVWLSLACCVVVFPAAESKNNNSNNSSGLITRKKMKKPTRTSSELATLVLAPFKLGPGARTCVFSKTTPADEWLSSSSSSEPGIHERGSSKILLANEM